MLIQLLVVKLQMLSMSMSYFLMKDLLLEQAIQADS
jgi:hypothetical protein